jgi:hypothetical protein
VSGKDNVIQAVEVVENVISGIKDLDGDNQAIIESLETACKDVGLLKNKPTLRTKDGEGLTFPILEAAQNLEEVWEETEGDDPDELQFKTGEFVDSVSTLNGKLKKRTVIMT